MEMEELDRICHNCNNFFPSTIDEITDFGICLNDKEFEPFIDELLENYNYACCQKLVDLKKFSGEKEACSDFSQVDIRKVDEFADELISSIMSGQLHEELLEDLLIKEQVRNIDFKTLPVDMHVRQLKSAKSEERDTAISTLGALIAKGNKAAFQGLFKFFKQLPPPKTIEEVHFKKEILRYLELGDSKTSLTNFLIDELYNIPSNNTTRQWISSIFRFIERSPYEDIREPLEKMLNDNRFSYRLKQKVKNILYR